MDLQQGPYKGLVNSSEIKAQLMEELLLRASYCLYIWSGMNIVFGFLSFQNLKLVFPELTIWGNLWPRILFNAIPAFLIGLWYRRNKKNIKLKVYSTVVVFPSLLLGAAFIYAWSTFNKGNGQFYLRFHATNIIVMASVLALISGSPGLIAFQILGFIAIFFGPLLYLFKNNNIEIFSLICNDLAFISITLFWGLTEISKFRYRFAVANMVIKNKLVPFMGKSLVDTIYEDKSTDVMGYSQKGLILALDLRGYTNFIQTTDHQIVKRFMLEYHALTSRALHQNGGYLHKTSGDGTLSSFGVMDKDADLSDLSGIAESLTLALENRKRDLLRKAIKAFEEIIREFEIIKNKFEIKAELVVGAGVSFGEIDLLVHGDAQFRQELDIDGESIILATRLESYSKLLNYKVDKNSSFLVISGEFSNVVNDFSAIKIWLTNTPELAIRDYPMIKSILYRQWKHNRVRGSRSSAAA